MQDNRPIHEDEFDPHYDYEYEWDDDPNALGGRDMRPTMRCITCSHGEEVLFRLWDMPKELKLDQSTKLGMINAYYAGRNDLHA